MIGSQIHTPLSDSDRLQRSPQTDAVRRYRPATGSHSNASTGRRASGRCVQVEETETTLPLHRKAAGHRVWKHLSWVRTMEPELINHFQYAASRDAAAIGVVGKLCQGDQTFLE